VVRHPGTRLAIVVLLALGVRAAAAQQAPPDGQRYPLPQAPVTNPAQPVLNQAMRYPLPAIGQPQLPPVAPASAQIGPQPVLFEPGQIVARVGDKTILYGDVSPTVNMILAPPLAKAKNEAERQAIEAQREAVTRNIVQQAVQTKMLLMEFERGMPSEYRKDDKKRKDAEEKIKKQVQRGFEASLASTREKVATASQDEIDKLMRQDAAIVRLAVLMRDRQLETPGELDALLREFGTTLEQQCRDYGEYMMGMDAVRTKIGIGHGSKARQKEVTHEEMLDYYRAHVADYFIPAKARFEILTVKFANFEGDREAAKRAIVEMGNAVYFGAPFGAVARKHSQEPRASDGGIYDWVTPGSLASKPIDRAVFSLEVDRLSQIIEDEQGLHIIRVRERKEEGQVSFQEAQPKIKEAIENQRRDAERQKYLLELRTRTKVWTIFDPPADAAGQNGAAPMQ
jgi:PPIC-type PPIASE domain